MEQPTERWTGWHTDFDMVFEAVTPEDWWALGEDPRVDKFVEDRPDPQGPEPA